MKKKSTLQNIFFNSFGTLFYYGCQWLTTVLIVRLAGFDAAGIYSLAMTFTAALGILALFNTRQYQVSDVKGEFTDKTYIMSRFVAIAVAFLVCVVGAVCNGYSAYKIQVILWYMLFKCVEALVDVFHGIDQKNGRMDFICYSYIMRGVLMIGCFCGVIYITGNLKLAIMSMTVATLLVVLGYDAPVAWKFMNREESTSMKAVKTLMMILIPLVIVSVTNNLSISLPKYFLERYYDATVLGYYSSVATPTIVLQVGASTIFVPLITPLADKLAADDKKGFMAILKKVSIAFLVLSILALAGSALLGRWVLGFIFGEEILPYTYLFVPIIISTLLICVNASLFPICTVLREIRGQVAVGIAGILFSVAASMILIPPYGMNGVVISLVITLCVQIIIEIYFIYLRMKKWKENKNG